MTDLSPINLVVAFAAGTLSFLSPCMLPLVPGYLAVLAGGRPGSSVRGALAFVAGLTTVFVLLGIGSGWAGGAVLDARRPLEVAGGVLVTCLGLLLLAGERVAPALQRRFGGTLRAPAGSIGGAFVLGAVFAAAWSPCIGPTLGAILTLAAAEGGALEGGILLGVFAVGLGVPFVLLALGVGWAQRAVAAVRRRQRMVTTASGLLLVVFGVLLAAGVVGRLSSRLAGIPGLEI